MVVGAVYVAALWWVEIRLTHKAIKSRGLRFAAATPIPLLIALAIWSGSAPLAATALLAHATVVGWRFWKMFFSISYVFKITTGIAAMNAVLVWLLF